MNILENLSNENAHIEAIREQLFNVVTLPLYPPATDVIGAEYDIPKGATFKRPPNFGNYKQSGGECLGVLGKDFRATQPSMLLDAFSQCLIDTGIDLKSLFYEEVNGGRRVRFGVDLEPIKFRNMAKVGDVVSTRLVLQTGYDGYTATTFQIETEVLKCTNGMVGRGTSSKVRFKNTKGNIGKIAIACNDIAQMVTSSQDFGRLIRAYDKTSVSDEQVDAFLKATIGYNRKEREELGKVKTQRLDELMGAIDREFTDNGKTAWGLLNGLTRATNHLWTDEDSKLDYLTAGAGFRTNDKAQKFLNELVMAQ
jgi:hypothetical protein